jgi:hypothetical protein
MISPIPTQRFITNRYADGRSIRSWLARLRPLGCASKSANHVGVHGVSAFWPNRRCRKYSSTSPTIRYSSSTHRPITLRRVGGNLARNARTQHPAAPDATAADPGCTAARAPCCAACTSSQALLLCTGVKSAQMRQCTTRGDSRENRRQSDDTEYANLHTSVESHPSWQNLTADGGRMADPPFPPSRNRRHMSVSKLRVRNRHGDMPDTADQR